MSFKLCVKIILICSCLFWICCNFVLINMVELVYFVEEFNRMIEYLVCWYVIKIIIMCIIYCVWFIYFLIKNCCLFFYWLLRIGKLFYLVGSRKDIYYMEDDSVCFIWCLCVYEIIVWNWNLNLLFLLLCNLVFCC